MVSLLRSIYGVGLFLFAFSSFATVELSLQDLRKEVLNENLDIKIQYEKYYQSQKGVSVALGQFLPSASINLINVNAYLAILQSVVPTPGDWFAYQASKELRMAEKFTTETIKLNILEGLTVNFMSLKHQEALMDSLKKQEQFLAAVYEEVKKSEELGMASASDVFLARRNLLQHRQDIYALDTLMIAEKQHLLIALNKSPNEELVLADLQPENTDGIPETAEKGAELAIHNSTELLSNTYQAEAARYMVSSQRWSFISFNGIGFDYAAKLSIEKSKARIIELQAKQIELKIRNQVYAAYDALDFLNQRIELQKQVVNATRIVDARNTELYMNRALSFAHFYESKTALASEERSLIRMEMERRVKLTQIKRLLGMDASLNAVDVADYDDLKLVKTESRGRRGAVNFSFKVDGSKEHLADIFAITYSVEDVFNETRMVASESSMAYYFKLSSRGTYKVIARIQLVSGDVIVKEEMIEVK